MRKTYFTSDLHLFANRSHGERHLDAILRRARTAECFVLGGDIFDFRWATTATQAEAINEAIDWLATLTSECPDCRFFFIYGNHDSHRTFIGRVADLEQQTANLEVDHFYARIGVSVFLHGDVASRKMTAEMLAADRARWNHHKQRGRFHNRLYDLTVAAKLHKPLPYLVYPKKIVAKRILAYLGDVGQGPNNGVRHVYFGHTHRPLSYYRYGGVTFHNGGAPIKGMNFRIIEAEVGD